MRLYEYLDYVELRVMVRYVELHIVAALRTVADDFVVLHVQRDNLVLLFQLRRIERCAALVRKGQFRDAALMILRGFSCILLPKSRRRIAHFFAL